MAQFGCAPHISIHEGTVAYDDAPLYYLKQAIGFLDQDWRDEYANAYEALEGWFALAEPNHEVHEMLVRDIDQLFADEPDAASRAAHFPHNHWDLEMFDEFLRAIRKRAV